MYHESVFRVMVGPSNPEIIANSNDIRVVVFDDGGVVRLVVRRHSVIGTSSFV